MTKVLAFIIGNLYILYLWFIGAKTARFIVAFVDYFKAICGWFKQWWVYLLIDSKKYALNRKISKEKKWLKKRYIYPKNFKL